MERLNVFLRNRSGFTFVEMMVVVVVLGVLANITIPHLSDWQMRIQADRDAEKAAISYILGAAVDVVSRNHGGYMYEADGYGQNATIRWQRPCRQAPVTQLMSRDEDDVNVENYVTGYTRIINDWTLHDWNPSQKWNVTDYIEHFPVGYAVEIVFAARDGNGVVEVDENHGPKSNGYHDNKNGDPNPYDIDRIIIYQFIGDVVDNGYWSTGDWDPLAPTNYPYATDDTELTDDDWKIVFPDSPYH